MRSWRLLYSWSPSGASGEEVVRKRDSWFTDHLLMLSRGQHSSALCPHVCLAGQTSIQTAGMAALGSSKISSPVAWNALLLPLCPSASFPNFPTQLNAHLVQEAFPEPQPCPPIHHITFNHCACGSLGYCRAVSHSTGWSFPWYRERAG